MFNFHIDLTPAFILKDTCPCCLFVLQVIYASSVQPGLKGFGFCISGGKDMDSNTYPGIFCERAISIVRGRPYECIGRVTDLSEVNYNSAQ